MEQGMMGREDKLNTHQDKSGGECPLPVLRTVLGTKAHAHVPLTVEILITGGFISQEAFDNV